MKKEKVLNEEKQLKKQQKKEQAQIKKAERQKKKTLNENQKPAKEKKKKGLAVRKTGKSIGKESAAAGKIPFTKKMGVKITGLIAVAVLLASTICMLIVVPNTISVVTDNVQSELRSLVMAYSSRVNEKLIDLSGVISYDGYKNTLQNMKIDGVESSYAFVVNSDGQYKFHPDEAKVNQPVEAEYIKELAAQVKSGKTFDDATVVEYSENGSTQYAAFQVLSDKSIIVIAADKAEILESVTTSTIIGIVGAVIVTILCSIMGLLFAMYLVRPIHKLIGVIDETAALDFADDTKVKEIAKRGDEIGLIGKAVSRMRNQLLEIVLDIQNASMTIYKEVCRVNEVSNIIREECTDNSATTEELAAGMEETSATTGTITQNIDSMQSGVRDILNLSQNGVQLSDEITGRALSLQESTQIATQRTTKMYSRIKNQAAKAVKAAESVEQINEMTNSIMQISAQTSLLALNASIEAARAGEAGKGFAVVATEIGKLANETSSSVTNINDIVAEVTASVTGMVKSMEDTTRFLESVILKDYDQFTEVSNQYNKDADVVKDSMKNVENSVYTLNESIHAIAESIKGINVTVEESASGVTNIAEKTSNVVMKTSENVELVDACMESVEKLEQIANKFKIG